MTSFSVLPAELLFFVADHLKIADQLNLSAVSTTLRELFVPILFSKLRFSNRPQDAEVIESVVSKYGRHARSLHFRCHLYPNPVTDTKKDKYRGHEPPPPVLEELPKWTDRLLSGQTLGAPKSVSIEFIGYENFGYNAAGWGDDGNQGDSYIADGAESHAKTLQKESEWHWRKVYCQAWDALSRNSSVLNLEVVDMVPVNASMWHSSPDQWRSFIAQLQTFRLSVWGSDNGVGWEINTNRGYHGFLRRLDVIFFDHALELTHLNIAAFPESPMGIKGRYSSRIALHPRHLGNLQVLELESCRVDPNLVEFMRARSGTLRRLSLFGCGAYPYDGVMTEDDVTWEDFFKQIHTRNTFLQALEVQNLVVPLTDGEQFPEGDRDQGRLDENRNYIPPDDEAKNITQIRTLVSSGERKLFSYIYLDDKYGSVFFDSNMNVERFEDGTDQREYDSLMQTVSCNARAAKRDATTDSVLTRLWPRIRAAAGMSPSGYNGEE